MRTLSFYKRMMAIFLLLMVGMMPVEAQKKPLAPVGNKIAVRYVHPNGQYQNSGTSWQLARNDLQATINELYNYLQEHTDYSIGHIYVAGGTNEQNPASYTPTESTGEDNTGVFFTAFKIKPGIEIYGGFNPDNGEDAPEKRIRTFKGAKGWQFAHPSMLTGNHTRGTTNFTWNEELNRYDMSFPRNSYHVVWFATGEQKTADNQVLKGFDQRGRALPLEQRAVVDGFIIEGGNASETNIDAEEESGTQTASNTPVKIQKHTSFGGGVYMVGNSVLRNCEVRRCHATRAGGAVYLDGGGRVEQCYVHTNQCEGIGLTEGYGGGVCVADSGVVTRSIIVDNMARIGGGLALVHHPDPTNPDQPSDPVNNPEKVNRYVLSASATIVGNNTSSTEAGGVLLMNGGTLNQMTIVHNHCSGGEVIVNDRRYGLSGGAYIEKSGIIFNSVLYGNRVGFNNLQYATYGGNVKTGDRPYVHYAAVEYFEKTDWSGTVRRGVIPLYKANDQGLDEPEFRHQPMEMKQPAGVTAPRPYERAGVQLGGTYSMANMNLTNEAEGGNGLDSKDFNNRFEYYWKPTAYSPLRTAGVKLKSFITDPNMHYAASDVDLAGKDFSAKSTLGAFNAREYKYTAVSMTAIEGNSPIYTLFVDPNLKVTAANEGKKVWGNSWDAPFLYLDDALNYVRRVRKSSENSPVYLINEEGKPTPTKIAPDAVFQILVKAGEGSIASNHYRGNLHEASIRMVDDTRIYGSFPKSLTGTLLTTADGKGRNPKATPTVLTADVMKLGKERNADHIIIFDGVKNVIFDGFHLEKAYALPEQKDGEVIYHPASSEGAGIRIVNTEGKAMTGNVVRNCKIANCTAEQGAAIYAWAKGSFGMNFTFENCIVHNNTSQKGSSATATIYLGAETGASVSSFTFNHCDVVKNVGKPIQCSSNTVQLTLTNSVVWANAKQEMVNSELLGTTHSGDILRFNAGNATVEHCAFDGGTTGVSASNKITNLTYQREGEHFPTFINPTKNIGAVYGVDQTYYGGLVDFTPRNMNPLVNAANDDVSDGKTGGVDFTVATTRDYGGAADIGALENTDLPKNGKVIYVRDYGNTFEPGGNGSSWEKAINGNYKISDSKDAQFPIHSFSGVDAEIPRDGLTGLQWAVDEAFYRSLKKNGAGIEYTNFDYTEGFLPRRTNDPTNGVSGTRKSIKKSQVLKDKLVEVWVGAGTYTKVTGFFMRDGVDVYGGFPAIGNPGMKQRSPRTDEGKTCIQTLSEQKANEAYSEIKPKPEYGARFKYNSNDSWGPEMGSQAYFTKNRYDLNVNYTLANQTRRVLTQPYPYYEGNIIQDGQQPYSIEFMNRPINGFTQLTSWDGFVIQNGRTRITHPRDGGAGVVVRYNGRIVNCVIRNNVNIGYHNMRGGGIFCNGGEIVNCIVEHNVLDYVYTNSGTQGMGGGLYLRTGTVYNTCFTQNASLEGANKTSNGWSGAVHFENGKFFNNTITENIGNSAIRTGNWFNTGRIDMYNTIVFNNPDCVGDISSRFSQYEIDLPSGIQMSFGNCLVPQGRYNPSQITIGGTEGNIEMDNNDSPFEENSLNLRFGSPAINAGNDKPNNIELPTFDAAYDDRIQDCRVDIGAYEYNGAKEIQPTIYGDGADVADHNKKKMVYYVSQNGLATGNMSANKENPACATKLQKVLDAAGRKRYELLTTNNNYKDYEIVVRLAGDKPTPGGVPFAYTAERSTDAESGNPRNFSLIVPHGITLEGGWDADFNNRNITANPTRISGVYQAEGQDVDVYHVVTFTNEVFDTKEKPIPGQSLESVTQRTILDGLYLEKGQANGEVMMHQKGGVAIVPSYGHVRNCILRNNTAMKAGGALHLQSGALVSGCLFSQNQAENGGAISVAKVGENLETQKEGEENPAIPAVGDMAHIYTSTIVNNTATGSGGALWFDNNVRVNSSVLWKNTASVDMNVSGQTNPNSTVNQEATLEFYPLAYCAVENVRVPGLNNIPVNSANESGVRFKMEDGKIQEYYEPTSYSLLGRAGMPIGDYEKLVKDLDKKLAAADFMDIARGVKTVEGQNVNNEFIEIGARAFNGPLIVKPNKEHLLRRLYVSKSNVNWAMVQALEQLNDSQYDIYKLKGSSFAYPMQHLDDALEYVRTARDLTGQVKIGNEQVDMKNVTYEIFVSAGTYYPFHNIEGKYEKSSAATFVVPEGVSIFGGMDNSVLYGQEAETDKEVDVPLPEGMNLPNDAEVIKLLLHKSPKMLHARQRTDRNVNGIVEPWEMSHQTILSGNVVDKAENVHHVITCLPFHVGALPENKTADQEYLQKYAEEIGKGKRPQFRGSRIVIDGLEIIDGEATQRGTVSSYTNENYAERGGGILVAGNLNAKGVWIQKSETNPLEVVGDRNIPLTVRNCRFNGNVGGEGAAIFSDGELKVYSCSFERNSAVASGDKVKGNGGAIAANYETTLVNTIFENNEAGAETISGTTEGRGGAVYLNGQAWSHMLNCNFVRNWAKSYPALYFVTPNQGTPGTPGQGQGAIQDDYANGADRHMVVNSIFWGNQVESGGVPFVARFANAAGEEQTTFAAICQETTLEALWFCGYENELGREPRIELVTDMDMREATFNFAKGSHFIPQVFEDYLKTNQGIDAPTINRMRKANFNVWLNTSNFDLNGPNFSKPSKKAGAAGYDASSSWMVTRPNNLTDNGWTALEQEPTYDAQNAEYTFAFNGKGGGIYFDWYNQTDNASHLNMALGEDEYMKSSKGTTIYRVSKNPDAKVKKAYIDIGVYEYRQIPLNPVTYEEVDVLWVCESENTNGEDADGHTRERATSDLQRAIETLLSSRNGHHKEIRLLEGRYTPKYTLNVTEDSNSGFLINTSNQDLSAEVPEGTPFDAALGINSLAFRGGWNPNADDYRDTKDFKSRIITTESGKSTASQFKHLFYIKDALQRKSYLSGGEGQWKVTSNADNRVVPIIFDGLVISNEYAASEQGSAIYYAAQTTESNESALPPSVLVNAGHTRHQPKLAILRCEFVRNGAEKALAQQTKETSVVTIEGGGGQSLVYNSVFHSNADHPLTAVNTDVLNCTFALNGKNIRLTDQTENTVVYQSSMHNSVAWKNNGTGPEVFGQQLNDVWVNNNNFTYNAVTGIVDEETTYHNVNLSNKNSDLILGPNFVDPKEDATQEADILARDFSLLPSIRLLNAANADIYTSVIFEHTKNDGAVYNEEKRNEMQNAMQQDLTVGKHYEGYLTDMNNDRRYVDHAIDRGAYEYQHPLLRVVYVNPRGITGDGQSWNSAYNSLQMQDAIDMAAVYAHNAYQKNDPNEPDKSHAYVFMKGSDSHTRANLMMRAGVSVYGSIAYDFNETVQLNEGDVNGINEEAALAKYVQLVRDTRPGMVEPRTDRTVISSLKVSEGCDGRISLVDGLEVQGVPAPGETLEKITAPAVNLALTANEKTRVVMRNCIVDGFHNTNTAGMGSEMALNSVVRVKHALLYNVLTFNNKVEHNNTPGGAVGQWVATVVVGEYGYVENCTMVASDVKEAQPIIPAFYIANTSSTNVHNSYIYPGKTVGGYDRENSFCPYFDLPEFSGEPYLCYQLSEGSKEIDAGTPVDKNCPYQDFIDYNRDRDLLGNPRKIGMKNVDNGCFETWRTGTEALNINMVDYGGNYYPHEGSVVYLYGPMVAESSFDKDKLSAIRPGYLLLSEYGGWYGQGNVRLELNYAAVERTLGAYNLISLPFSYDYSKGSQMVSYDDHGRTVLSDYTSAGVSSYDRNRRADSHYRFAAMESDCWQPLQQQPVAANSGVLYEVPSSVDHRLHRFTALNTKKSNFVYVEDETPKSVALYQANSKKMDKGGKPQFTALENMGWNMVGMPYLVYRYTTGSASPVENYPMQVPHVIYELQENGNYEVKQSWAEGVQVCAGEAFFTQTAVVENNHEEVTFALPVPPVTSGGTQKKQFVLSSAEGEDRMTVCPSAEVTDWQYSLGADGLKWMAFNEHLPQIYLTNHAGTRFSWASAVPVETELKVGVFAGNEGLYTFALPAKNDFNEFSHIWLTDYEEGVVTDLKQEDYTVALKQTLDAQERFTLKFGGAAPVIDNAAACGQYEVFIRNGQLYVRGLEGGERIRVYDVSGRDVLSAKASSREFTTRLSAGVYIVKVNGNVYKVR